MLTTAGLAGRFYLHRRLGSACGVLLCALHTILSHAQADPINVPSGDPLAVQAGKERFSERCSFCHGGAGKGAKGPCLTCNRFRHGGSNQSLYANIAAGIPDTQMGAFGTSLSSDEILNIIAFLRAETARRQAAGELE